MIGRLIAQALQVFGIYPDRIVTADQLMRSVWLNILALIVALVSFSLVATGLFDWLSNQIGSPPFALIIIGAGGILLTAILVISAKLSARPKRPRQMHRRETTVETGKPSIPSNQPAKNTVVSMEDLAFSFIAGFIDQQRRNSRQCCGKGKQDTTSENPADDTAQKTDDIARPFETRKTNK